MGYSLNIYMYSYVAPSKFSAKYVYGLRKLYHKETLSDHLVLQDNNQHAFVSCTSQDTHQSIFACTASNCALLSSDALIYAGSTLHVSRIIRPFLGEGGGGLKPTLKSHSPKTAMNISIIPCIIICNILQDNMQDSRYHDTCFKDIQCAERLMQAWVRTQLLKLIPLCGIKSTFRAA